MAIQGMKMRATGPMAGLGWLKSAVNLGRNNPTAIFGGAALMMLVVMGFAMAAGMLQGILAALLDSAMAVTVVGMVLMMLVIMILIATLMVGYLRLIDAVESGRPARARDVFVGFRDMRTSLRSIGLMLLLAVLQYVLMFGLLAVFAGGFFEWYMQTLQTSMGGGGVAPDPASVPAGMGIATLMMMVLAMVFFAVQAISLGQVILRGRGVIAAIGDGFVGAFKNLLPLLVFVLACIVIAMLAAVVVFLLALLVGVLAKLAGTWLAFALGIPLYLLAILVVYVVSFGVMYFFWRDVAGSSTDITGELTL